MDDRTMRRQRMYIVKEGLIQRHVSFTAGSPSFHV